MILFNTHNTLKYKMIASFSLFSTEPSARFMARAARRFLICCFALACAGVNAHIVDSCIAGSPDSSCQKKEFYKNYNKTFTLSQSTGVALVNKFGKVEVKIWDKNSAQINVKITARAGSEAEANKTFDRISITFTEDAGEIKAETAIGEMKSGGWWGSSNNSDFSIDYEVFMPAANRLSVSNRYGHTTVGCLTSDLTMTQKYGDCKIDCAAATRLELGYGKGSIGSCGKLSGSVGYGKLNVDDSKEIQLATKYSQLDIVRTGNVGLTSAYDDCTIVQANNLSMKSRYGNYIIGKINSVSTTAAYTDFKINQLKESANFDTNYGSVKIETLAKGFSSIVVNGNYTDYALSVEPGAAYQLDFHAQYSGLARPAALKSNMDVEKGASKEIQGYIGDPNTKSVVRVRLNYGELTLK